MEDVTPLPDPEFGGWAEGPGIALVMQAMQDDRDAAYAVIRGVSDVLGVSCATFEAGSITAVGEIIKAEIRRRQADGLSESARQVLWQLLMRDGGETVITEDEMLRIPRHPVLEVRHDLAGMRVTAGPARDPGEPLAAFEAVTGLTHRHGDELAWHAHSHLDGDRPHGHDPVTGAQVPL